MGEGRGGDPSSASGKGTALTLTNTGEPAWGGRSERCSSR